eukprot:ANDGO_07638.mRNA.1 DNA polymerase alpha-associated DNA helicase A
MGVESAALFDDAVLDSDLKQSLSQFTEQTRKAVLLERTLEEWVAQNETHAWPCIAVRIASALKGRFLVTLKSASANQSNSPLFSSRRNGASRFGVGEMVKLTLSLGSVSSSVGSANDNEQEWKGVVSACHEKFIQVLLDDVSDALFAITNIDAFSSSSSGGATNSMLSMGSSGAGTSSSLTSSSSGDNGGHGDFSSAGKQGEAVLKLSKIPNDTTYKRISRTVDKLGEPGMFGSDHPVVDCLYGDRVPSEYSPLDGSQSEHMTTVSEWFNTNLNYSQKQAVEYALRQKDIGVILGPPGTGKTTTLVEVIRQLLSRGKRVLVCAASNVAVDNIVERLAASRSLIRMVRLGHPARLLPSVVPYALDAVLDRSSGGDVVADVRKDMEENISKMKKAKSYSDRRQLRQEYRQLQKELRVRERKALVDVVMAAQVVLATNTGSDEKLVRMLEQVVAKERNTSGLLTHPFDYCILDEAAQSFEISSWIPILKARSVILAGDHHQLPPTVLCANHTLPNAESFKLLMRKNFEGRLLASAEVVEYGRRLSQTLFAKLYKKFGGHMLEVQYRMHEDIMRFSSREFYGNKLVADPSVAGHRISEDLPSIVFVDTSDAGYQEGADQYDSKYNLGEVQIVAKYCAELIELHGIPEQDIGIISPYNAQIDLIRDAVRNYYAGGIKKPASAIASSSAKPSSAKGSGPPSSKTGGKAKASKGSKGRGSSKSSEAAGGLVKKSVDADLEIDDEDLGSGFLDVEISTVDGVQGREKDVILMSLVRCNSVGDVGFLADKRRLNVAITRARRHLFVVGDANTCVQNEFLKRLIQYWEEVSEYRTAGEFDL